jgi:deoxyhypusine synthase
MGMRDFMNRHFLHFNARETREAAQAWVDLVAGGGKMFLAMAGAMSTAELGISLAPLIRAGKIHGICCTGANLEEDVFNLVAHDDYRVIPNWRNLTPDLEGDLYEKGLNRVTDTCIPETVMRHIDKRILEVWKRLDETGERGSPWEIMRQVVADDALAEHYQVPREHSWVLAAHEMDIPVWVPGWEDSTLGNIFTGHVILGALKNHTTVHTGTEQMQNLSEWYRENTGDKASIGFFQIGGGIAGDYPICVVPMLIQDCFMKDTPFWAYFCQISDSTTSYGSYSGAIPSEKITWGKLAPDTPKFMINSDASIVAPLIFEYVRGE